MYYPHMDNLSHSVVGLAVGEFVHRSLRQEPNPGSQRVRRRLLLFSGWAASNFPDLDLFLTPLLPAPLGYLLHHRGHTHTLLYAIAQAILLWTMIWLCWPAARTVLKESTRARAGVVLSVCLGLVLHLLMDYLNSYGLHPFHPFDSRWLYGDMVFILEPLFWVAFGVPMAMMVQRPAVRYLLVALLIGAPLFFTIKGFLAWGSFLVLAIVAVVLGALQRRADRNHKRALIAALVLVLGLVGIQGYGSGQGKRLIAEALQQQDPESRVLDSSLSSFPTNPLCWAFVAIESKESAGTYRLRRGILSLAPDFMAVADCPSSLAERASQQAVTPGLAFLSDEQGSLATLRTLYGENCHFRAWLRFARAPSVSQTEATDIRFGQSGRPNFSTFRFADFEGRECPRLVPEWDFPRSDLLTPQASPVAPRHGSAATFAMHCNRQIASRLFTFRN
jgi:inner membrane protein